MTALTCARCGRSAAERTERSSEATGAVDRLREYRKQDTLIEADRLVHTVMRDQRIDWAAAVARLLPGG